MRAVTIFIFASLLLGASPEFAKAANCTSSDITLADQGDVNLFQQAFSGGGTCDTITGTLRIEETSGTNITDLTPLSELRYIQGDLIVYGTEQLTELKGLEAIQQVSGNLEVSMNAELGDCSALYELLETTPRQRALGSQDKYISPITRWAVTVEKRLLRPSNMIGRDVPPMLMMK